MIATVHTISPWLWLLIGIALILLSLLVFKYQPVFQKLIHRFLGAKHPSSTYLDFQRVAAALILLAMGSFAVIGSLVHLI